MTNPLDGLQSLQEALDQGLRLNVCKRHPELQMIFDQPNGCQRLTYALIEAGVIKSYSTMILVQPLHGIPCFNIGYATSSDFQGNGLATEMVEKSIDELKIGFQDHQITRFYIEAVISVDNIASVKVANKVISDKPSHIIDEISGEKAFYYTRLVE